MNSQLMREVFLNLSVSYKVGLSFLATLRTLSLVGFLYSLVRLVSGLISSNFSALTEPIIWAAIALLIRVFSDWAISFVCTKLGSNEKEKYRNTLVRSFLNQHTNQTAPSLQRLNSLDEAVQPNIKQHTNKSLSNTSTDSFLVTFGVEELNSLYTQIVPVVLNSIITPIVILIFIFFNDVLSVIIIALTLPLTVVFMILIGHYTGDNVQKTQESLQNLTFRLTEMVEGLAVLVGLGRAQEQSQLIIRLGKKYRHYGIETLKVAFLSSFALELIATISVAVVAVFIGVRLVSGQMNLETGLIVLMVAPECYLPFRQLGNAFHASQKAQVVLDDIFARDLVSIQSPSHLLYDVGQKSSLGSYNTDKNKRQEEPLLRLNSINIGQGNAPPQLRNHSEKPSVGESGSRQVLYDHPVTYDLEQGKKYLLSGPSGAGKSSLLELIAGIFRTERYWEGAIEHDETLRIFYLGQDSGTSSVTLDDEFELYGLYDIEKYLEEVNLQPQKSLCLSLLSPGEKKRFEFARLMADLEQNTDDSKRLVLLDEPTAHLDTHNSQKIRELINNLSVQFPETTWVISSHDPELRGDHRLLLNPSPAVGSDLSFQSSAKKHDKHSGELYQVRYPISDSSIDGDTEKPSRFSPRFLYIASGLILSAGALSGIALAALSGWLITEASTKPPIFFLTTAIVGVRFFGLARAILGYWGRLVQHDAIFTFISSVRQKIWNQIADLGLSHRLLSTKSHVLSLLVGQLQVIENSLPRAVTPAVVVVLSHGVMLVFVWFLLPEVLILQLCFSGGSFLILTLAFSWIFSRKDYEQEKIQVLENLSIRLENIPTLAANNRLGAVERVLDEGFSFLKKIEKSHLNTQDITSVVLTAWAWTICVFLPFSCWEIAAGNMSVIALVVAFILANLALNQVNHDSVPALEETKNLREALKKLENQTGLSIAEILWENYKENPSDHSNDRTVESGLLAASQNKEVYDFQKIFDALEFEKATIGWPQGQPSATDLNFTATPRSILWITGPSGSGKSTLLATIMGYTHLIEGKYSVELSLDKPRLLDTQTLSRHQWDELRDHIAWSPQSAHIFSSTIYGNLQLARKGHVGQEEMIQVLERVGLQSIIETIDGLNRYVGPQGSYLSGGQQVRLAVARALLTGRPVILLDEPTAHLDIVSARLLIEDLSSIKDRIILVTTHDVDNIPPSAAILTINYDDSYTHKSAP